MSGAAAARTICLNVNGEERSATAEPRVTLVDFLRHGLRLTGTHVGCEQGVCGACTVLIDGFAVRGCLMLAVQAEGRQVQTIESLGTVEAPHALQRAFLKHHALQCGYCTPGISSTTSIGPASWRPRFCAARSLTASSNRSTSAPRGPTRACTPSTRWRI